MMLSPFFNWLDIALHLKDLPGLQLCRLWCGGFDRRWYNR
uniref:Uncharacterized protein n=1 Tax=Anguilla anguilla TaxID=7936 RepID=A0A0E9XPW7_ANGAN